MWNVEIESHRVEKEGLEIYHSGLWVCFHMSLGRFGLMWGFRAVGTEVTQFVCSTLLLPLAVLFGFSFICISSVNQRSARWLPHTIRLSVTAVDVVLFPMFFPRSGCDWLTHFLAEKRNNNNRIPSILCHWFCFVWSCESPAHRRVNTQRQTTDIHTDKHCRAASGLRVHVFGLWEETGGPDTGRTCKCHTRFLGLGIEPPAFLQQGNINYH